MSNGLNDFAQNAEMRVGLREPFPKHMVQKIQKKNHTEDYVNHAAVTDRLNAEAPGWMSGEPQFIWSDGHIVGVFCSMTIGSVTRWEVGDADGGSDPGDEAKKAMSDWLKRAAMRFGVGVDLWSKIDLSDRGSAGISGSASLPPSRQPNPSHSPAKGVAGDNGGTSASDAFVEGATVTEVSLPIGAPERPATTDQWAKLLSLVDASTKAAADLINEKNGTMYTYRTAKAGATWAELEKAMT